MSKIKVLLVEDSPDDARLIERILTRGIKNIAITWVDKLDAFKAELKLRNYSVVITDLNVGDITGFDFIDYMHKANIKKPIIMVTATNDKAYTMKALEMQVDDYVSKSYKYLLQLPYIVFRVLNFPPSEMIEKAQGLDLKRIGEEYTDIFNADRKINFKLWLDGSFMSTNHNFDKLVGYQKDEIRNLQLRELVDESSLTEFEHLCHEIELGKEFNYAHLKLRSKTGKLLKVEAHIELETSGGKVIASLWNVRDISDLDTVQKNFLNYYQQYASIFGFSKVPTILIDQRTSILQINPAASQQLACQASDILGTNLLDMLAPKYEEHFVKLLRQQMEGSLDKFETELGFLLEQSEPKLKKVRMTLIRNYKQMPRLSLLEIID